MNTPVPTNTCRQCGGPMASNAPEGLCARCLLSVAMKEPDPSGESDQSDRSDESDAARAANLPHSDIPDIADAAEVARRLPQFEILELLGRGGMGVVYKARQLNLDRIVALKILPPTDALTPDFVERFRREARSLAKLSHTNIVAVYDFGESRGLYFFVMEYVDGVNLRAMIRAGKMKPEEALAVVPKICDALQFAHEEGVVHRDIKPENILIDKRGRVKIADFGLAKLLRREQTDNTLTMSGMTLGTPRYMAPEQMDKPETVDHRADIYSLGVVFYEMLTGEVPMGRFAPPSERVQIDVRLDEIVLHALERDADRRYQHASQVRDDVEKVTSKPMAAPAFSHSEPKSEPTDGVPLAERLALVKACLVLLIISAVVCIADGLTGFTTCLSEFLRFRFNDQTWYDFFLSAIVLGAGIAALGTSVKALRNGRQQMAWIAALILVAATPLVEGMRRMSFVYLPPGAHFFFGALALGCFLTFRFVPQVPAAFALLAAARREKLAGKNDPVERARASWFGRRSERFRTLLPPALVFLELALILASIAGWPSPWIEWTRTFTPHKHGVVDSSSSFGFHPFTFSFCLLVAGFVCPFIAGRLSRIDNLVRYGRRFRELREDIRRQAKLKIFGFLAVTLIAPFLIAVFFVVIAPGGMSRVAVVTTSEYRLAPNSKAYDELLIEMPFRSSFENGAQNYCRPNHWEMSIGLKAKENAKAVTMDIEMPSLKASYDDPKWSNMPHEIVLDNDELTKWMGEVGKLDVKDEAVKKEAAELMALLKQFSRQAPANEDEFTAVNAELMPDFRFAGYKGLGGSFSSSTGQWAIGIYLGSAVIFLALYFVVGIRTQRAAFALDREVREVRERGESALAPGPLPRVKFGALPRDIRARMIWRAALIALGLLLLPATLSWWDSEQGRTKQTYYYSFDSESKFYKVITMSFAFESYERGGETWLVQPKPFPLELAFTLPTNFTGTPNGTSMHTRSQSGVPEGTTHSFTVELPGLRATFPKWHAGITLDAEGLEQWLRESFLPQSSAQPEDPDIKRDAAQLMVFLKRYATQPPSTLDAFVAAARKMPPRHVSGLTSGSGDIKHSDRNFLVTVAALTVSALTFFGLFPALKRSAVRAAMRQGTLNFAPQSPAPADETTPSGEKIGSEPRLSRLALWGAIWAPLFFVILILSMQITGAEPATRGEVHYVGSFLLGSAPWQLLLEFTLLPAGIFAPFGTTILGALGIRHIKRSGGKLYGLRLAAIDVLFFPLIALMALIFTVVMLPLVNSHIDINVRVAISVLPALAVCFFAGRAAWRAIVGNPCHAGFQ